MLIPHYSIFPPGYAQIPKGSISIGLAGYQCDQGGQLCRPAETTAKAALLVFHDLIPIPDEPDALAAQLVQEAQRLEAELLYADLERPPDRASLALLEQLAGQGQRLLIPAAYADDAPGEPVILWQPEHGSFDTYLQTMAARYPTLWLEYAPVCQQVQLQGDPAQLVPAELAARLTQQRLPRHDSRALLCRYAAAHYETGVTLYLWDNEKTMAEKLRLAEHCGLQGVLTLQPEVDALLQSGLV